MRKIGFNTVAVAGAAMLFPAGVHAIPVTFDTFGPLPQATFGGTGIPNDEVAAGSQFVFNDVTITVALSATQRFNNPALTSDGAGTFFATPGSNTPPGTTLEGSLWNFNYYVEVASPSGSADVSDFQFDLLYDFDPAANSGAAALGRIDLTAGTIPAVGGGTVPSVIQGSQNLLFNFLDTGVPGIVTPPPLADYDPDVFGEYTFALLVSQAGFPLETVAMKVQVIPEPATAGLALIAASGLLARRRRI